MGSPVANAPGPSIDNVTDAALTTDHETVAWLPLAAASSQVGEVSGVVSVFTVGPVGAGGDVGFGVVGGAVVLVPGCSTSVVKVPGSVVSDGVESVVAAPVSGLALPSLLQAVRPSTSAAHIDRTMAVSER